MKILFYSHLQETGDIYSNLVGKDGQPQYINPNSTNLIDELIKIADYDLGAYRGIKQ